jgi:hypothetical protein
MMPYETYRLYKIERPKNLGEIRQADEQAAQFVSAVSSLFSGFAWPVRRLAAAVLTGRSRRRGQFQLDAVRIFEREHVNAKRRQCGDLAMADPALIKQPQRVLQVIAAADAEAEVVKADPVGVEAITGWRHGSQSHDQVAPGHDHTTEKDFERLVC